jgi:hypothetical protein
LPSAIGNVIQSAVEQKQNTIVAAPAAETILQGLNSAQQRAVAYGISKKSPGVKAARITEPCHRC